MIRTRLLATVLAGLLLSACSAADLNNSPLPFTHGNDDDSYEVTVTMENVTNLVPNAEVKVGDLTVGSVRRIEFDDWKAKVVLGLDEDVDLPADADAKIAQKSLLGASYVELTPPADEPGRSERLRDGSTIPLARSGRYPETEEVFAALSVVLNGGGLAQVQSIVHELDQALDGRTGDVRSLLGQLNTLLGTLNAQKADIVDALDGVNRLSGRFAHETDTVRHALDTLPAAVEELATDRAELTRMLTSLDEFGRIASTMIRDGRADLRANLKALQPTLRRLADSGDNLTDWLGAATFPFPSAGLLKSNRGDYLNIYITIDLSARALERDWVQGTPLDGILSGLTGGVPAGPSVDDSDPLTELPEAPLPSLPDLPGLEGSSPKKPPEGSADEPSGGLGDLLGGLTGGGR